MQSLMEKGASMAFGAYDDGHIDKSEFAAMVMRDYGRSVPVGKIDHLYCRKLPDGQLVFSNRTASGAQPVTVTEW